MQKIIVQEEPRGPSILIEVNVPTNGQQRVAFPDISQLRSTVYQSIIIKGLRLITSEVLTNGVISPFPTAPATELAKMTVTIYAEGWEKGQTIPLLTLNDMQPVIVPNPSRFLPTRFDNWTNVDWPKSYLQYANSTTSVGAPYVVLLDCEYLRLDAQGQLIQGPSR